MKIKGKEREEVYSALDGLKSNSPTLLAWTFYYHINEPFRTFKVMNN